MSVYTVTEEFIRGAEKALEMCDTHPDDMEANLWAVIGEEILHQRAERAAEKPGRF